MSKPLTLAGTTSVDSPDVQDIVTVTATIAEAQAWVDAALRAVPGLPLEIRQSPLGFDAWVGGTDEQFAAFEAWFYPVEVMIYSV